MLFIQQFLPLLLRCHQQSSPSSKSTEDKHVLLLPFPFPHECLRFLSLPLPITGISGTVSAFGAVSAFGTQLVPLVRFWGFFYFWPEIYRIVAKFKILLTLQACSERPCSLGRGLKFIISTLLCIPNYSGRFVAVCHEVATESALLNRAP